MTLRHDGCRARDGDLRDLPATDQAIRPDRPRPLAGCCAFTVAPDPGGQRPVHPGGSEAVPAYATTREMLGGFPANWRRWAGDAAVADWRNPARQFTGRAGVTAPASRRTGPAVPRSAGNAAGTGASTGRPR